MAHRLHSSNLLLGSRLHRCTLLLASGSMKCWKDVKAHCWHARISLRHWSLAAQTPSAPKFLGSPKSPLSQSLSRNLVCPTVSVYLSLRSLYGSKLYRWPSLSQLGRLCRGSHPRSRVVNHEAPRAKCLEQNWHRETMGDQMLVSHCTVRIDSRAHTHTYRGHLLLCWSLMAVDIRSWQHIANATNVKWCAA